MDDEIRELSSSSLSSFIFRPLFIFSLSFLPSSFFFFPYYYYCEQLFASPVVVVAYVHDIM